MLTKKFIRAITRQLTEETGVAFEFVSQGPGGAWWVAANRDGHKATYRIRLQPDTAWRISYWQELGILNHAKFKTINGVIKKIQKLEKLRKES